MDRSEVLEFENIKFIYDKNNPIQDDGEGIIQVFIHNHPQAIKNAISLLYSDIQNVIPEVDFDIEFKHDEDYAIDVVYMEHVDVFTKKYIHEQLNKHISFSSNEINNKI